MTDDALIAGAAAPARGRLIRSPERLDLVWVVVVSFALGISALFELIDLPTARLRTGDAPLRVFVVALPIVAILLAVVAAVQRSVAWAAAATGVVAPGVALAGSLSLSLFLDEASAFADVGVAVSLGAALLGVVMFLRWFVYHPLALVGSEQRPERFASLAVAGLGGAVGVMVVVAGVGDGVGVAWFGATAGMVVVPVLVVVGGLVRTVPSVVLAATAAAAQVVAVVVEKAEQSSISFGSDLMLRTGVVGLVGLTAAGLLGALAILRSAPDAERIDVDDDEPWRWSADE